MKDRLDVLVCYDVATVTPEGEARLRRMAKACSAYGQRVQYSVFELSVTPVLLEKFLQRASSVMDVKSDSLRVYLLRGDRSSYLQVFGRDGWTDFEAPLIV
ncbi:MAG: CRISPR-associated endonuclease Cas2 [Alphaproteobacteria bacterium]|nr:MAG: CRISPR-associated endonuclease Cas2 [Alphaproteobacteria bacterium]